MIIAQLKSLNDSGLFNLTELARLVDIEPQTLMARVRRGGPELTATESTRIQGVLTDVFRRIGVDIRFGEVLAGKATVRCVQRSEDDFVDGGPDQSQLQFPVTTNKIPGRQSTPSPCAGSRFNAPFSFSSRVISGKHRRAQAVIVLPGCFTKGNESKPARRCPAPPPQDARRLHGRFLMPAFQNGDVRIAASASLGAILVLSVNGWILSDAFRRSMSTAIETW